MSYQPTARGLYFEEFAPGRKIVSGGRTITEADVVGFAGLSGDYNQIHMDAEFAAAGPFGTRVAHGMLGFSIASGLAVQTRHPCESGCNHRRGPQSQPRPPP